MDKIGAGVNRRKNTAHGVVPIASRCQEIVSVASQGVCFTCIICVPRCQPQVGQVASAVSKELYQLRLKVPASCVFIGSRVVNHTRMNCNERYGCIIYLFI
jgi:hypothetical protein